jgi:hypothetical protein
LNLNTKDNDSNNIEQMHRKGEYECQDIQPNLVAIVVIVVIAVIVAVVVIAAVVVSVANAVSVVSVINHVKINVRINVMTKKIFPMSQYL